MLSIRINLALLCAIALQSIYALENGDQMPNFRLKGTDGKIHDSDAYASWPLLAIVFISNHCPVSQSFQEELLLLEKDFAAKGFKLIAVSPNDPQAIPPDELAFSDLGDSYAEMKIRAKDLNYTFPYLYDGLSQDVSQAFGVRVTPHAYLFDANRSLRYSGRIGDSKNPSNRNRQELRQALKALMGGGSPKVEEGPTFGSSIKWKKNRHLVQKINERFSRETIVLKHADKRTYAFIRKNVSSRPKLIYVWSSRDENHREDLLKISALHKIYRKRGIEFITACIDGVDEREKTHNILRNTLCSSQNYISEGTEISPFADLRGESSDRITPFLGLLDYSGKISYRSTKGIYEIEIKKEVLKTLNRKQ